MKSEGTFLSRLAVNLDAAMERAGVGLYADRKRARQPKARTALRPYQEAQRTAEVFLRGTHGLPLLPPRHGVLTDRSGRQYRVHPETGVFARTNRPKPRMRRRNGVRVQKGSGGQA